ncbi:MAG: hypothetical protein DI543_19145 [Bradyrhizobium icense]|nr:MAG: hypothetical protein DI543_19145 [Bradyrhizobium icense]
MLAIKRCDQFNKALAGGAFAWPGGYPLYFLMADGESLAFDVAGLPDVAPLIRDAIIAGPHTGNDDWRVVAVGVNWEDSEMTCVHTGRPIECAYPPDDEEEEEERLPFVAGWNMPGYMPDCEPAAFATFDEAKRYIIGEIKRDEEHAESEEEAETLAAFAEDVNLQSGPFGATCGKYHYYVTEA